MSNRSFKSIKGPRQHQIHFNLGGFFVFISTAVVRAADLPVPVSAPAVPGNTVGELVNPALHPTINAGHASGVYSADGHRLTVNQSTDKAVLDWSSFDIAAGNTVQFNQPGASSVALNNIYQASPSQILGNLNANGQVFLVNSNGFVFGQNAAINTNTLVATSLNITDSVFDRGIVNVVDANATASGGTNLDPVAAFSGDGTVYRNTGNGQLEKIKVLVEPGASINAAPGGRVILAAPEVDNRGSISSPDGQVILAAATDRVYLQASDSNELRGLLVEVGTGGNVKNTGKLLAERGNTTLLGFAVSQEGIASASTSVALNGSVRLLAREGARLQRDSNGTFRLKPVTTVRASAGADGLGTQAKVVTAPGSRTSVELDASAGFAVDEQSQPASLIDIEAGFVEVMGSSLLQAQGGKVNITASAAPDYNAVNNANGDLVFQPVITPNTGVNNSRIVLDPGSKIDVSGVKNVTKAITSNIVDVELRDYELRDAPLQRTGILHGQTVHVDVRKGIQVGDASGALARIQRSIYERNINAGTVRLQSESDVIVGKNANIDISGGSLHFLGGQVNTTYLVSNGIVYDISKADPNLGYQKIINNSHYEADYFQGGNAGSIAIQSRGFTLEGDLTATTTQGLYQRSSLDLPLGGELSIDTTWSGLRQQDVVFLNNPPATVFDPNAPVSGTAYLTGALFSAGISRLNLATGGRLTIDGDFTLGLPANGDISLQAGEIYLQGKIFLPSGDVSLKTKRGLDPTRDLSGLLDVAAGSVIDTRGTWVNDSADSRRHLDLKPQTINGGDISLTAQGDLLLENSSRLVADGGAWVSAKAKVTAGTGGNINLSVAGSSASRLELDGALSSYSLSQGGKLGITANDIDIASTGTFNSGSAGTTLHLANTLFQSGGFGAYELTANAGGLDIEPGTVIRLLQANWQLNSRSLSAPSRDNIAGLVNAAPVIKPDYSRKPVDLSLNVIQNPAIAGDPGVTRNFRIGTGAQILADAQASLSLDSDQSISIDGLLSAPAGKITINLTVPAPAFDGGYDPNFAIELGSHALINAAGTALTVPNLAGLNLGSLLDGGQVQFTANRGYIVTDANSRIDVSGSQSLLDVATTRGRSTQQIASNGGSINLTAAEGLLLQGQLSADPGTGHTAAGENAAAAGGSLALHINAQNRGEPFGIQFPVSPRIITLSETPQNLLSSQQINAGSIPDSLNGMAYISARQIEQGGFDSVTLASEVIEPANFSANPIIPEQGEIRFDGNVSLALKQNLILDAPFLTVAGNAVADTVNLSANIVTLGSSFNRAAHGELTGPVTGSNTLNVNANLLNLQGSTEIGGVASTNLTSNGDIRLLGVRPLNEADLLGSLNLNGNLNLLAREIYPTTFSQYSINIDAGLNPGGQIYIDRIGDSWSTPLSAAGRVQLSAPNITSHGRLLAPFGQIVLDAGNSLALENGSITSVSDDDGIVIPFGRTQGGLSWLYPLGNFSNIQSGTPQKSISLKAPAINLAGGAQINLNGGGDLSAFEFISGSGGSNDTLDTPNAYAVLPSSRFDYAAYDALEFAASGLSLGESVYLSANSGLPAGDYVLLPAHYALLPGAFLITPQANTQDIAPGTSSTRIDGAPIVAGYLHIAGTNVSASHWQGFAVEPGSIARTRSEYQQFLASQFFTGQSAGGQTSLPQDAGNLSILAGSVLTLEAAINAMAAPGGLGGSLDISADRINIAGNRQDTVANGSVAIYADDLNRLNVDSILLGGIRNRGQNATQLTVSAQSVNVAGNVALHTRELLLAATDTVTVAGGASLAASGSLAHSDTVLDIANTNGSSDGALLRVSSAGQARVQRAAAGLIGNQGTLVIAEGATLESNGSVLLDASKDTVFDGNLSVRQGDLALNSSLITLGDSGNLTGGGLHLSQAVLDNLDASRLALTSYSAIELAGDLNLTAGNLVLDAAAISGNGSPGQTANIIAQALTLQNSSGTAPSAGFGTGGLTLQADTVTLAGGNYALNGFTHISVSASKGLVDSGTSAIAVASDLTIASPLWTAQARADTRIDLSGHNLTTLATTDTTANDALGASLAVNAQTIFQGGRIDLASGQVKLAAAGQLDITGSINVSGRQLNLAGNPVYTSGGTIDLSASQGNLTIGQTARLNVSGSNGGGIKLSVAQGSAILDGTITGQAESNGKGGDFNLDSLTATSTFTELNSLWQLSGFSGDLTVRQRQGNITVAAGTLVNARNLSLTADSGNLDIFGNLDVSAGQAGSINLSAADALVVHSEAVLNALSSDNGAKGGKVLLSALNPEGADNSGVTIQTGANIRVAGGAGGEGGSVQVLVDRRGSGDAPVSIASGVVSGASSTKVTAVEHYTDAVLSNAEIQQWRIDTQNYLTAAAGNGLLQSRLGGFTLEPGLDVASTGSLTLDLSEVLNGQTWTRSNTDNRIWTTQLADVAGLVNNLQLVAADGSVTTLTNAGIGSLNTDNSYYFDANPNSSTFRTLFVRINTGTTSNPRYLNPSTFSASLVEHNGWDFELQGADGSNWHFGNDQNTGWLSLRAAGDLNINQTINDGFAVYDTSQLRQLFGFDSNWLATQILQTGLSWSYNLAAGADLASADVRAVQTRTDAGSLTIGSATSVRTGTGEIQAQAAGDIRLTDWTSTLYTAGHTTTDNRWGSFGDYRLSSFNPANQFVANNFFVEYPFGGGNIELTAGGDIIGASTPQFLSDWLQRTGTTGTNSTGALNRATAWGIAFDGLVQASNVSRSPIDLRFGFRENIGTLGGGNITIHSGGDIKDLSVVLPDSAKPVGTLNARSQIVDNVFERLGGGNLTVAAQGNIEGGVFYAEQGRADIRAGKTISGGSQFSSGPVFALGDAQFSVQAGSGIEVGAVLNPFVLTEPYFLDRTSYFTTYSPDSAINFASLAGNIQLNNDTQVINDQAQRFGTVNSSGQSYLLNSAQLQIIYPGSLSAQALSGDLKIENDTLLYPASGSSLNLLAGNNIFVGGDMGLGTINQLDVDPAQLLSPLQPSSINAAVSYLQTFSSGDTTLVHSVQPIHANDSQPNTIAAANGSIIGNGVSLIAAAKATNVFAGLDIINLGLQIQNLHSSDTTLINAGRDILFTLQRDPITGAVSGSTAKIELAGPGLLAVEAGRDIDLGISDGITTVGNTFNPALAQVGADIQVLAGNSLGRDFKTVSGFLNFYLGQGEYKNRLDADGAAATPAISGVDFV